MTRTAMQLAFDRANHAVGYEEGYAAWVDADEDARDGGPPEHLTEGMSAHRRDGFRDGWGDAMVEGGA